MNLRKIVLKTAKALLVGTVTLAAATGAWYVLNDRFKLQNKVSSLTAINDLTCELQGTTVEDMGEGEPPIVIAYYHCTSYDGAPYDMLQLIEMNDEGGDERLYDFDSDGNVDLGISSSLDEVMLTTREEEKITFELGLDPFFKEMKEKLSEPREEEEYTF